MKNGHQTDTYELYKNRTLERPRFSPHQIVTDLDMTMGMQYPLEKLRQHNRLLHGWGIVCGAKPVIPPETRPDDPKWDPKYKLVIQPGNVLDPLGNMIWIPREVVVDIRDDETAGYAIGPSGDMVDPWCSQVKRERKTDEPLYIAVRYAEYAARPVRKPPSGCGCHDSDCENTRIYDSFIIRPFSRLPANYADPLVPPDWPPVFACGDDCPEDCPADSWVILAVVNVKNGGNVQLLPETDNLRRYVVSFRNYFYVCPRETTTTPTGEIGLDRNTAEGLLKEMLNQEGYERLDGRWEEVPRLYATDLVGVKPTSALGLVLGTMTIEEVDTVPRDDFIVKMGGSSGLAAAKRAAIEKQAGVIWDRAHSVMLLTKALMG